MPSAQLCEAVYGWAIAGRFCPPALDRALLLVSATAVRDYSPLIDARTDASAAASALAGRLLTRLALPPGGPTAPEACTVLRGVVDELEYVRTPLKHSDDDSNGDEGGSELAATNRDDVALGVRDVLLRALPSVVDAVKSGAGSRARLGVPPSLLVVGCRPPRASLQTVHGSPCSIAVVVQLNRQLPRRPPLQAHVC